MIDDDELDRMLREARPDEVRPGAPLSPRAEADLQALLATAEPGAGATPVPPRPHRRHRTVWIAAAAAAMIAAVVAIGGAFLPTSRHAVYAVTPPIPQFAHMDGAAAPLLEGLAARAAKQKSRPASPVEYEAWVLDTEMGDKGVAIAQFVQPQEVKIVNDGVDATVTMRAGMTFDGDGTSVPQSTTAPGTVLSEYSTPVGFPAPPNSAAAWDAYLSTSFGIGPHLTGSEVLNDLTGVLNFWTLSPAQNAALLGYLATLPDISVAGTTTDRLGRAGIAFQCPPLRGSHKSVIIVDAATGRILGMYTLYIGPARAGIESPSVNDYTLWK